MRGHDGHPTAPPPLAREIAWRDPLAAMSAFEARDGAVFLDSALPLARLGRYSFVAVDPVRTLVAKDGRVSLDGVTRTADPWRLLQRELGAYRLASRPDLPPFQGGVAGVFGYELARHLERLPAAPLDDFGFPDLALGIYDAVVAFDNLARRAWIVASGYPERDEAARRTRAEARIAALAAELTAAPGEPGPPPEIAARPEIAANFERAAYEAMVQRVIDYIHAGDIFQANLSQRFLAALPPELTPFGLYRRLRARNPAPFAAYLRFGELALASSSPERFLALADGRVETRPIKGTRPRGPTPLADSALAQALLASEKDRAENVMIVDLMRNDLSRVCRDGTVEVPELCIAESYATVFHLVSTVTGALRPGLGAVDLLRACFPGGSITGAPKIRAMEIIAELEPHRRGPYCGSIGYLGFDGAMDTSIVIRTFALMGNRIAFNAGGGIVADSRPADEYDETLAKARALMAALGAEG